jgi:hypothetical protein
MLFGHLARWQFVFNIPRRVMSDLTFTIDTFESGLIAQRVFDVCMAVTVPLRRILFIGEIFREPIGGIVFKNLWYRHLLDVSHCR